MLTSDPAWRSAANIAKPPELVDTACRLGARVLPDHGARCHLVVTRGHLDWFRRSMPELCASPDCTTNRMSSPAQRSRPMRPRQFLLVAILSLPASAARAETIDVSDFHGGLLSTYQTQWSTLAARGVKVRIVGPCVSACTILVGYIPRNNICVMPNAYLGFHWATTDFHTQEMWSFYPPDIRQWISQRGGLTSQMLWLQAPSIYRYFRKC